MSKDITSPGLEEDTRTRREVIATEGGGVSAAKAASDVRKKKKVTDENVETSNLEQYILSQNIEKAANYFLSNSRLFNYRTFRQVNGNGAQLVNRLRGIDNLDVFYRIKNSTLSLMRPKIRIYKVKYEENTTSETGTEDQGGITALSQPCYKEFKFSDNFGMERAASVQDYLSYESTKPSWRNVGLESFSVKQDGRKHGAIENNIECSLVLTFKSLKDIQAQPPGEPSPEKGGLRFVDLITWAPARVDRETETYNPKHYEIKALVGYTAPTKDQLAGLNLSQRDIDAVSNIEKLNVILSLSLFNYDLNIKDDGQVQLTAKYRGRIETTIGTNQVNVFQNTFRISKDGNIDISKDVNEKHNISSVFKLRTTLNSVNRQLKKPSCTDEKCPARKTLRSLVEKNSFFTTVLREAFPYRKLRQNGNLDPKTGIEKKGNKHTVKGNGSEMFAFFREDDNVDKIQAVIKQKIGLYKKDVFKSFTDQLIDGNTADGAGGTRLFCIQAGSEVVKKSLGIIVDEPASERGAAVSEADAVASSTTAIPKGSSAVKIDRCHLVSPVDPAIKNAVAQEINSSIESESTSKDTKTGEKKKDPGQVPVRDFSGKSHKFYFVYLGDIIELACKNAGLGKLDLKSDGRQNNEGHSVFSERSYFREGAGAIDYPLLNSRILLGPMEYYNEKGQVKVINLAQFPISFNYFRAWFMKKVVKRRRPQMPLGSFLAALINDLVKPALGVGMPKSFRAPLTESSIVSLTLPGKQGKKGEPQRNVCGENLPLAKEALPMRQIIDVNSAIFEQEYYNDAKDARSSESLIKTSFDYILIYMTTHKNIIERRGDPAEDVQDGIYHFNIGSDMGLLKNMKFSRVNIPFMAELRAKQAEEQGVDALDQLKFPYNTDLVLIGTSLFTPGMFYYVNPSLAGLGSVEDAASLAYKMNLGGYHLIQTVTTKITPNSFTTTVKGTQTSQGRR